ncbi:MAG: hypothetical protein MUE59_02190 [Thiobacillaceae bacterium]|jgi:hypothetical protein|nr:hypothetical protein [Thiobacillaceae bacterium]
MARAHSGSTRLADFCGFITMAARQACVAMPRLAGRLKEGLDASLSASNCTVLLPRPA